MVTRGMYSGAGRTGGKTMAGFLECSGLGSFPEHQMNAKH